MTCQKYLVWQEEKKFTHDLGLYKIAQIMPMVSYFFTTENTEIVETGEKVCELKKRTG